MNIITGYKGEAHITAQEDRDINLGVIGKSTTDLYVLDVGQQLEADIVSANEIRVKDGVLIMQGCAASIDYGSYDSLTISNGSQGMQRIDVIAAQYERDGDTNVESVSLVVIEGTPAATNPSVPSLTSGSIQGGDSLVQMPLYYVNLDGVSVDSVVAQFYVVDSAFSNSITEATKAKWSALTGNDGSTNDALDYVADNMSDPIEYIRQIDYSALNSGWTATYNGFMVFSIVPSNSSAAYAVFTDTDDQMTVCYLSTTGGASQSCAAPIIKGHTYKISVSSSNVQATNRTYGRLYSIM